MSAEQYLGLNGHHLRATGSKKQKLPSRKQKKADLGLFIIALQATAKNLALGYQVEYCFHPTRKWRFDFAIPDCKLAVEFDGGQWAPSGGRHSRDSDRVKLNAARELGWTVFQYSNQQIATEIGECVAQVERWLNAKVVL